MLHVLVKQKGNTRECINSRVARVCVHVYVQTAFDDNEESRRIDGEASYAWSLSKSNYKITIMFVD